MTLPFGEALSVYFIALFFGPRCLSLGGLLIEFWIFRLKGDQYLVLILPLTKFTIVTLVKMGF